MIKQALFGFLTTFVLFGMAQCGSCGETSLDRMDGPLMDTLSVYGVWPHDLYESMIELESSVSPMFVKVIVADSVAKNIRREDLVTIIFDESGRWEYVSHLPKNRD